METQGKLRFTASTSFFLDVIGIVVIFIVLKELQQIFIPLVLAYFLFFVFSPMNHYLGKNRVPAYVAVVIDILIILFVVGSFSSVIIDSLSRLGEELPLYELKLDNIVSSTAASWGINDPHLLNFHISEIVNEIDYRLLAGNLFTSTFSFLGSFFFVLFFFIFVVTGHENIYNAIKKRYLKIHGTAAEDREKVEVISHEVQKKSVSKGEIKKEKTVRVKVNPAPGHETFIQSTFNEITDQVQRYITTKFLMSLIMGVVVGIILWIFGVDFVIIWAVLTFLFHFIPNIGSIIAVILPCLIALVQYESFGYAAMLAVVLIVVQNIIGSVLEPKVFGNRLGLNPLVILLSLLLWGYIWGIVGAILSVPLTAIVKIIISRSDSQNLQFLNDLMGNEKQEN